LRDGSLVNAYRLRAQARVKQFYDWEHVVDRYEQLFAEMCGQTPTRAPEHAPAESEHALTESEHAPAQAQGERAHARKHSA
jgi:hypothetical protein